ncbi:hypothetical protein N7527_000708 [Penicillium freii]|nr:hypothetical protein N7527_000708 [Penicillium freii]
MRIVYHMTARQLNYTTTSPFNVPGTFWPWRAPASGQSADWQQPLQSTAHFEPPPFTSNTHINQSGRGGLRLQDNRQTGNNHFNRRPTSNPPPFTSNTHINQSGRGGHQLQDNRQTGNNNFNRPPTSNTHINQSGRGGLRLQDNRQTGYSTIQFNRLSTSNPPPLLTPTSTSLTVAGISFRTIGRLVTTTSIDHPLRTPPSSLRTPTSTSLAVAGFAASGQLAD